MNSKYTIFGLVLLFSLVAFALGHDRTAGAGETQPPLPTGHPKPMGNHVQFSVGNRNVKALLLDGEEAWIGTSSGLVRYNADTSSHRMYTNKSGLLSNGVFYVGKVGGEIWVGTYGGGLSVLNPETGKWRNYNIPQGMADAFVYDVLETSTGDIWIATWSGANLIKGGEIDRIENWLLYTVENTGGGLPNDWVYGMAEGRDGTIWLATEGGLARFVDGQWTNWQHEDGLGAPYDLVKADMPFRNDPGEVSGHHARQKQEQGLEDVAVAYNPNYIVSLEVDDDGNVWAGTWGGGLSRFDGKTWTTFTVRDGLPGNHIFSLGRDRDGMLWVGTSRGLAAFDGDLIVTYSVRDGLVSDTVFSIAAAEDGNMWVGTFGGATWFPHGLSR
jgi:ligand-binding sensor domain-containing protein